MISNFFLQINKIQYQNFNNTQRSRITTLPKFFIIYLLMDNFEYIKKLTITLTISITHSPLIVVFIYSITKNLKKKRKKYQNFFESMQKFFFRWQSRCWVIFWDILLRTVNSYRHGCSITGTITGWRGWKTSSNLFAYSKSATC